MHRGRGGAFKDESKQIKCQTKRKIREKRMEKKQG
jgi:hypothetical protein